MLWHLSTLVCVQLNGLNIFSAGCLSLYVRKAEAAVFSVKM